MKNSIKIFCILIVSAWLYGCGSLEYFEPAKNIVTDPLVEVTTGEDLPVEDEWVADRNAQEINFRVSSNADWTASVDQAAKSWCSVNPPSSNGNSRLLVRLRYNDDANARKATIRIVYSEEVFAEFILVQKGAPLIDRNALTVAKFKSSSRVVIAATEPWTSAIRYSDGGGWCSLSTESGESGTFQVDVTTDFNSGGARTAFVDVTCGEITETLEISQMADFETFVTSMDKGADTLRITWNKIAGATSYRISAARSGSGEDMGHIDVDTTKSAYDFFPVEGNLFAGYTGKADVTVEALTLDAEIAPIKGTTITTHTLYDDQSGDGTTAENAFIVSTRRHFANVRHNASGCFQQNADIDLMDFDDDTSPANGNFTPIPVFSGIYDGGNYEIKNLSIALIGTASSFVAPILLLGGDADAPAELNGIKLVDLSISNLCTSATTSPTGGMVAKAEEYAKITGCTVKGGSIAATNAHLVGGLIGQALSTQLVSGCTNEGCAVTGSNGVGGIAGQSSVVSMIDCHNSGTISANTYGGGLCGNLVPPGTIKYSSNKGDVICRNKANTGTGGIIGRAYGNNTTTCSIEGCFNTGKISAASLTALAGHGVGGIVGVIAHQNTIIRNCYNAGPVQTSAANKDGCGGILGTYSNNSNVKGDNILVNNYNVGTVETGYAIVSKTTHAATTITGNYYLETSASAGALGLTDGFTALPDAQMKLLSNFTGWDPNEWKEGDATWPYPQLINNPHK